MEENNVMPLVIFPGEVRSMIETCREVSNFPVTYTAAAILAAVATVIGNTNTVKVKNGYIETPMLYVAMIGQPGVKKSPVIKKFFSPIFNWEVESRKEYNEILDKTKDGDPVPKCPHLVLDDTTVEALEEAMSDNPWGICLWADELVNWLGITGRYSKDTTSNSIWMKIFNGLPIFLNRKNTRKKTVIENPCVTVIGGIQYNIFRKHFSGSLRDNGLLSRLLPIFDDEPDDLPYDTVDDFPQETLDGWNEHLMNLMNQRKASEEFGASVFTLSEDAVTTYSSWSDNLTDKINRTEPVEMREFFAKLKDYVFRLALIFELLHREYGTLPKGTTEVSGHAMVYSTLYADYIYENYRRVIELLSPDDGSVPQKMMDAYNALPKRFSKSDVNRQAELNGMSESWADKFCSTMTKAGMISQNHGRRGFYIKMQ